MRRIPPLGRSDREPSEYARIVATCRLLTAVMCTGLPDGDNRRDEVDDVRGELVRSGISRRPFLTWEAKSGAELCLERITGRDSVALGLSLVLVALTTGSFVAHTPAASAVGGLLVACWFTSAAAALAATLLLFPRLEHLTYLTCSTVALAFASLSEALLVDVPFGTVSLGLRVGLGFVGAGLMAIATWAALGGRCHRVFVTGIAIASLGAFIAGAAELEAARLLHGHDDYWAASSGLSGVAALWVAWNAPRLAPVARRRSPPKS